MFMLQTSRLLLVSTPLAVIKTRLEREGFVAPVPIATSTDAPTAAGASVLHVYFPPEWPGDALVLFPTMEKWLEVDPDHEEWGGTIIDRAALVAVGQMSFKALPDETGSVEIGYGINPSAQRRGYATEMARGLVDWALAQPTVRRVTAECLEDNGASIRVLQKVGFRQVGRRLDDEGPLLLWERTA